MAWGARGRAYSLVIVAAFAIAVTIQEVRGLPWPVAPQDSAHAINKTYGDWNGDRCYVDTAAGTPPTYETHIAYHTGVDIPKDSGTAVLAAFDGYVNSIKPAVGDTGYISIARTLGGNPAWHYGHVIPDTSTFSQNTPVSYGDTLGYVAQFHNPGLGDHLHFCLELVGNLTESVCNPLDSLVPAPSQDVMFGTRNPIWDSPIPNRLREE